MTDLQITQLDSGLTVATERVPGALSVATGVWVRVGARDEPDHLGGVTHFLEHLLFKGTERRSAVDISRTIDRYGGDINAFTTKEYTAYYCRLPARHAEVGIDLLGDVVGSPALRDADLEIERQVILEEIAMDDDSPDDVAHRVFGEEVFLGHSLGRDTAGSPHTVEVITGDDARAFFAERYTAGSMVVSVAGPVAHAEMLASVERAFVGVRPGAVPAVRTAPVAIGADRHEVDDTEQVHLVVGGRALPRDDPDREALDVVNHVLGGGLSSRLFDEIREKRGLVYSVFSSVASYSDVGVYAVSAGTQPDNAAEVLQLIRTELTRLAEHGITPDELDVARGYLTGSFELGLEDTGSRMARNGGLLCTRGHVTDVDEQVRRWHAVEMADTHRVIERIFTTTPLTISVGP